MRLSAVPSHAMTAPSHDPSTSLITRTGPHASASDFSGLSLDVADSRPSHQLQNPPLTKWLIIGSVGGAVLIMAVLGVAAAMRPAHLQAGDAATSAQAAAMAALPPSDPKPVADVMPAATSNKATKKVAKKTETATAAATTPSTPAAGDAAGKPSSATTNTNSTAGKSTSKPATGGSKSAAATPPAPSEPDFSDLPPPPDAAPAPAPAEPKGPSAEESASEDAEAPAL
jgi:hypothetical protein